MGPLHHAKRRLPAQNGIGFSQIEARETQSLAAAFDSYLACRIPSSPARKLCVWHVCRRATCYMVRFTTCKSALPCTTADLAHTIRHRSDFCAQLARNVVSPSSSRVGPSLIFFCAHCPRPGTLRAVDLLHTHASAAAVLFGRVRKIRRRRSVRPEEYLCSQEHACLPLPQS